MLQVKETAVTGNAHFWTFRSMLDFESIIRKEIAQFNVRRSVDVQRLPDDLVQIRHLPLAPEYTVRLLYPNPVEVGVAAEQGLALKDIVKAQSGIKEQTVTAPHLFFEDGTPFDSGFVSSTPRLNFVNNISAEGSYLLAMLATYVGDVDALPFEHTWNNYSEKGIKHPDLVWKEGNSPVFLSNPSLQVSDSIQDSSVEGIVEFLEKVKANSRQSFYRSPKSDRNNEGIYHANGISLALVCQVDKNVYVTANASVNWDGNSKKD